MAHTHIKPPKTNSRAYQQLLEACLSVNPQQDETTLTTFSSQFSQSSHSVHKRLNDFRKAIAAIPLSALVLVWGESVRNDPIFGHRYLEMMCELIDTGMIPLLSHQMQTLTLYHLSLDNSSSVIERIRCFRKWPIAKREHHILVYKHFSQWLSKETVGYVPEAQDLDQLLTQKRAISFERYIEILSMLQLREQILTKLFYLGGSRSIEEVLSLRIEDIDFERGMITFAEQAYYPRHLLEDIKTYITDRSMGFVFMGRDSQRISHTTPFRALKTATTKLNLDPGFTFKDLTKNL